MIRLVLCKLHCSGPAENGPQRSKGVKAVGQEVIAVVPEERWWCLTPVQPYSRASIASMGYQKKQRPHVIISDSQSNSLFCSISLASLHTTGPKFCHLSHSQHTVFQPAQTGLFFLNTPCFLIPLKYSLLCPELHVPSLHKKAHTFCQLRKAPILNTTFSASFNSLCGWSPSSPYSILCITSVHYKNELLLGYKSQAL